MKTYYSTCFGFMMFAFSAMLAIGGCSLVPIYGIMEKGLQIVEDE